MKDETNRETGAAEAGRSDPKEPVLDALLALIPRSDLLLQPEGWRLRERGKIDLSSKY